MSGKAYGAWLTAGFDMWMLGAEAASVMALRTARIAAGGPAGAAEAELMVTEKIRAAIGRGGAGRGGSGRRLQPAAAP